MKHHHHHKQQQQPVLFVTSIRTELENDLSEISDAARNVKKLLLSPISAAIDGGAFITNAMDNISNSAVAVSGAAWNFVGQMWDEVIYE
jgi:hypothetical protein